MFKPLLAIFGFSGFTWTLLIAGVCLLGLATLISWARLVAKGKDSTWGVSIGDFSITSFFEFFRCLWKALSGGKKHPLTAWLAWLGLGLLILGCLTIS